jgi:hypothetical protein
MHAILATIALAVIVSLTSSTAEGRAENGAEDATHQPRLHVPRSAHLGCTDRRWVWR